MVMADIAHIAGMVAVGMHPSPVPHCEYVTTTTHKTLRGPRGGMIMCKTELAEALDKAVFPGVQGGPLMHVIAAKAVAFAEALQPSYREYIAKLLENAKALCASLQELGWRMVSGGTDTHLMLINLGADGISGKKAEDRAGQGRHHGQQEHRAVRHAQALHRLRHPHRDARRHHPRHGPERDEDDRQAHRPSAAHRGRDGVGSGQARGRGARQKAFPLYGQA